MHVTHRRSDFIFPQMKEQKMPAARLQTVQPTPCRLATFHGGKVESLRSLRFYQLAFLPVLILLVVLQFLFPSPYHLYRFKLWQTQTLCTSRLQPLLLFQNVVFLGGLRPEPLL